MRSEGRLSRKRPPLGWFEIQNLPPDVVAAWKPLVARWKRERDAIHGGFVYPVGERSDGFAWTSFVSVAKDGRSGTALLFRELSASREMKLDLSRGGERPHRRRRRSARLHLGQIWLKLNAMSAP